MEIKKNEKYESEIEKIEENKNQEMILIVSFIIIAFLIVFFLFFNGGKKVIIICLLLNVLGNWKHKVYQDIVRKQIFVLENN